MKFRKDKRVNKAVGRNIRDQRYKAGLTQVELAAKLKCSQNTLSMIENGKMEITVSFLYRLCGVLKIKIHDILDEPDVILDLKTEMERMESQLEKMGSEERQRRLRIMRLFLQ